jgi:FKBP12-rapamycin complex-associated protein
MRCSRFANLLRSLDVIDVESMEFVAYAIGRIALATGSITDSYVDYEVTRAFEFISENNNDSKKQLGVS